MPGWGSGGCLGFGDVHGGEDGGEDEVGEVFGAEVFRLAPIKAGSADGPAGHGGADFDVGTEGAVFVVGGNLSASDEVVADEAFDLGFDDGGELALMFLAAGGEVAKKVADGEDELADGGGTGAGNALHAAEEGGAEFLADHVLKEGKFVGEVVVEGGAVNGGAFGDVLHGDGLEALLGEEGLEGLVQHLTRAADAGINDWWWRLDHVPSIPFDKFDV